MTYALISIETKGKKPPAIRIMLDDQRFDPILVRPDDQGCVTYIFGLPDLPAASVQMEVTKEPAGNA